MGRGLSEVDLNRISSIVYLDIIEDGIDREEEISKKETRLAQIYGDYNQVELGTVIDYYLGQGQFKGDMEGPTKLAARFSSEPGSFGDSSELDYWREFLKELDASNQQDYRNWKIKNIVNDNVPIDFDENSQVYEAEGKNREDFTGFVAYTIEVSEGVNVVGFRGSEPLGKTRHVNDWVNNLRFFYEDLGVQEALTQQYIEDLEKQGVTVDYITGHSLGGHLALFAAMELSEEQQVQLKQCVTFAAPGFNQQALDRYRKVIARLVLDGKIKEIQNEMDPVGDIMFNPTTPEICSSNNKKAGNAVNHSNFLLEVIEDKNGNLAFERSKTQNKHSACDLVKMITVVGEMLPQFLKKDLIESVVPIVEEMTQNIELDEAYLEKLQGKIIEKLKVAMSQFKDKLIQYAKINPTMVPYLIQMIGIFALILVGVGLKVFEKISIVAMLNQFINDLKANIVQSTLYLKDRIEEIKQGMVRLQEAVQKEFIAITTALMKMKDMIRENIIEDFRKLQLVIDKTNEEIEGWVKKQIAYMEQVGKSIGIATEKAFKNTVNSMSEINIDKTYIYGPQIGLKLGVILGLGMGIFNIELEKELKVIDRQVGRDLAEGIGQIIKGVNKGLPIVGEAMVEGIIDSVQDGKKIIDTGLEVYIDTKTKLKVKGTKGKVTELIGQGSYKDVRGDISIDIDELLKLRNEINDVKGGLNRSIDSVVRAGRSAISLASRESGNSSVRRQIQVVDSQIAELKKLQSQLLEGLNDLSQGVSQAKSIYAKEERRIMNQLNLRV